MCEFGTPADFELTGAKKCPTNGYRHKMCPFVSRTWRLDVFDAKTHRIHDELKLYRGYVLFNQYGNFDCQDAKVFCTHLVVGGSVGSIGVDMFRGFQNLSYVECEPPTCEKLKLHVSSNAFRECSNLLYASFGARKVLFGGWVFALCYDLVFVGAQIESDAIPCGLFFECRSLTSVTLSASIKHVCMNAFTYCNGLKNIKCSAGTVTFVGRRCFYQCNNLSDLGSLTKSVRTVASEAFSGCFSLNSFTFTQLRTIGQKAFNGCSFFGAMVLPNGLKDLDSEALAGLIYVTRFELPSTLERCGTFLFEGDMRLNSVTFYSRPLMCSTYIVIMARYIEVQWKTRWWSTDNHAILSKYQRNEVVMTIMCCLERHQMLPKEVIICCILPLLKLNDVYSK